MTAPNHNWRKFKNAFMQTLAFVCAILVITPLLLVFYHLIKEGFSSINWAFFTQLPKPVGETAAAWATPSSEHLSCSPGRGHRRAGRRARRRFPFRIRRHKMNWWIRFAADILNGVPSITWGIVVYALMVVPMHGFSALAGGVVLGMMMIPLVMRTTEEVLQLVPGGYREAALALGISKWRTIVQIVIRTAPRASSPASCSRWRAWRAKPRRCCSPRWATDWTHKLTEPIAAMPLQIFAYAISPYDDWHRQAWAARWCCFCSCSPSTSACAF
jgi:phosphate transport system permease protein